MELIVDVKEAFNSFELLQILAECVFNPTTQEDLLSGINHLR